MILPDNSECRRVLDELEGEPSLSQWEHDFIDSNAGRQFFTDRQREIIFELQEKYDV